MGVMLRNSKDFSYLSVCTRKYKLTVPYKLEDVSIALQNSYSLHFCAFALL